MVRLLRVISGCLAFSLLASVPSQAELSLTGSLRNDAAWWVQDSSSQFVDLLENKWVIENKAEWWRFYADLRLWLLSGPLAEAAGASLAAGSAPFAVRIPRAFVRFSSDLGVFSLGKTYAAFGLLGVFNPFELDRSINVTDLGYVKEGVMGLTWELSLDELSGLQAYVSSEGNSQTTAAGVGFETHALGFDAGLVALRRGTNQNQAGVFLKGDLEVEAQASLAWNANDRGQDGSWEAVAGLDYSLLDGEWLVGAQYAYKGRSADREANPSGLAISAAGTFGGRQYLYAWLSYVPDQFFQARCDLFCNVEDRSSLVVPSATWVLADGLSATLLGMVPTGAGWAEYGYESLGRAAVVARAEAKF